MADSGYSGTPLPKRLGLKEGFRVLFVGLPEDLHWLSQACDFRSVDFQDALEAGGQGLEHQRRYDVIHWFGTDRARLEADATELFSTIVPEGSVWISWPKKASKIPTSMTEDVLRTVLLPTGLVDVKVCAVNEIWSGLKFVIRKELRKAL